MKYLFLILSFILTQQSFAQNSNVEYYHIDRRVQDIKPASPAVLAEQLTSHYKTELEKVRSIFRWITENIEYRVKAPYTRNKKTITSPVEFDTSALKSLDERVAENVLQHKLAICDGYARLFKTLCDFSGIQAEVITGYGRTEAGRVSQRFRSNHTWNAVRIDNKWHLLDVTWASGFLTWSGNEFIQKFDEQYFLSDPRSFIRDHYPDDMKWTLLDQTPVVAEFRNTPFKQRAYIKYQISSFSPSKGLIEARIGDTLYFHITTRDANKDKLVSADPFLDTSQYRSHHSILLIPVEEEMNKVSYSYVITSNTIQWIYLLYNDDLLLRYRLTIRSF